MNQKTTLEATDTMAESKSKRDTTKTHFKTSETPPEDKYDNKRKPKGRINKMNEISEKYRT